MVGLKLRLWEELKFKEMLLSIQCVTNISNEELNKLGKLITHQASITHMNRLWLIGKVYNIVAYPESIKKDIEELQRRVNETTRQNM